MAKLPTYRELGGVPSGRSGRVIASYDTSAVGRGMIDYGSGMARAGDALASVGNTIGNVTADLASSLGEASKPTQQQKFETQRRFFEFSSQQQQLLEQAQQSVEPGAVGFREQVQQQYQQNAKQFFSSIPDALKPEYDSKLFVVEDKLGNMAGTFESAERQRYYTSEVNQGLDTLSNNLYANPDNFDQNYAEGEEFIESIPDESLSKVEKDQLKQQWRTKAQLAALSGVSPEERIRLLGGAEESGAADSDPKSIGSVNAPILAKGITEAAGALGINPLDLATAISYETGGTFNPSQKGPTTKWGQHKGLIQFGEPQAAQYGVDWENPAGSQLGADGAIVKYLRDAGVKPGMGMLDIYSAINAGSVGRYNASDTAAGGAPGTVRDKVEKQMGGHRKKAAALLGGDASSISGGGTFDPAKADPRFADLPYGEAAKIINDSRKQIVTNATITETAAKEAYQLQIATDPMSVSVDSILADERLDDGVKAEIVRSLKAATKEELDRQGAVTWAKGSAPSNPFDEDDKKRANLAYEQMIKDAGPEYSRQVGEYIAGKKGVVPKPYVNEIRAGLLSGNAGQVSEAAELSYRLSQSAPQALKSAENSGDLIKAATAFDFYANDVGLDREAIGRKIQDMNDPDKQAEREAVLKSDVVKEKMKKIDSSFVADQMSIGTGRIFDLKLGGNDVAAAVMTSDYKKLFEESLVDANGDFDLATKMANDRFGRTHGPSPLSQAGENVITYLPATKTYQALPDGSHDYLVAQAMESLELEGIKAGNIYFEHAEAGGQSLTEKAFKAGDPVPYQIFYEDENGQVQAYPYPFSGDYDGALAEFEATRQSELDAEMSESGGVFDENLENQLIGREKSLDAYLAGPETPPRQPIEEEQVAPEEPATNKNDAARRRNMSDALEKRAGQIQLEQSAPSFEGENQIRQDLLKKRGMESLY